MALCLHTLRASCHGVAHSLSERGGPKPSMLRLPAPAAMPAAQPCHRRSIACRSYAGPPSPSPSSSSSSSGTSQRREGALEALRAELRSLEEERDAAVATAESCARTCVRLTDMSKLLEDLALEKVKAGDEAGAKLVLQEKNSLREIIDKSNGKAQTNFALAGKLATKIGDKHAELVALMGSGGSGSTASGSGREQPAAAERGSGYGNSGYGSGTSGGRVGGGAASSYGASWPEPPSTSASGMGSSSSPYGSGAGTYGSGGGGGYQMPWERSIAEAQQRVRQAEAEAQRMGRLAALSAEDSIAAARERLATRRGTAGGGGGGSAESILEARERLRRAAEASIAEARERLRSQDAAVLEYCRRIVGRYRRGEYVAEEELEFAFEQLERRLL